MGKEARIILAAVVPVGAVEAGVVELLSDLLPGVVEYIFPLLGGSEFIFAAIRYGVGLSAAKSQAGYALAGEEI